MAILDKIVDEHFKGDSQIENYLNNPYIEVIEKDYLFQYEVCIRQGNNTLAMWLKIDSGDNFLFQEFIPSLYKDIEWVSEDSLKTFEFLYKINKSNISQMVVNFDKFNKRFRLYIKQEGQMLNGYDIEQDGKISKKKMYTSSHEIGSKVITMHSDGKITVSDIVLDFEPGFRVVRDDGQEYLVYQNNIRHRWKL